ncbi:hypothetical protein HII12_000431 [Brettanomyces bruxellensis]|uniref:Uncharacterized protein n=1 Tax=Dekkera bruxellensis TaxID=5007 RepID=A0A8H6BQG5_DEKBR|nr:hypothetical protein HII12_000431 [Brettanomyces bruxellensis]
MGICISCLRSDDENVDQNVDENTPLMADNEQNQKQTEEELRSELRNKELNNILNSANDHLIDLGSFIQQESQSFQQPIPSQSFQHGDTEPSTASSVVMEQQKSMQQPQAVQDMTMSNVSHVTTNTVNASSDIIKVEVESQQHAKDEVDRNLNALKRRLGPERLEKLTAIDTSKIGPLVATLE